MNSQNFFLEDYIDCNMVIQSMIQCYSHGSVMSPWKIPLLCFFKSLCCSKDSNWYVLAIKQCCQCIDSLLLNVPSFPTVLKNLFDSHIPSLLR